MKYKVSPFIIMALMGMSAMNKFGKIEIDELAMHLKLSKRTLEQEYKLVKYKISSLSRRLRNQVIYEYEKQRAK